MNAIENIKKILGPKGWLDTPHDMVPYLSDWRGRHTGKALGIAFPKNTGEVSAVVKACYGAGIPMVPQGGNTGLVQGGVPREAGNEVVINLKRMNKILNIDVLGNTAELEAGVVLEALQTAAKDQGRLFPLSLGAEGTCQVGGNLATNAGGVHVLRYGPMRDLVLGLEVVLPSGEVWDGLKALRKDNAGYDLKHMFIGAEGTLGIITRAVLKLFPLPRTVETACIVATGPKELVDIFTKLSNRFGERLSAFEIFPRSAVEMVLKHIPATRDVFALPHPWYAIAELWDTADNSSLKGEFETALARHINNGAALDVLVVQNLQQGKNLWKLRDTIAEAQKKDGDGIKHDVSVPIRKIPEFIERADAAVEKIVPGFKRLAFGHAGDGNIHYDPCPPEGMDQKTYLPYRDKVNRAVNDIVAELKGSISAEHGIGTIRLAELTHYKPAIELKLFKTIKTALDPKGLMNPGKLI